MVLHKIYSSFKKNVNHKKIYHTVNFAQRNGLIHEKLKKKTWQFQWDLCVYFEFISDHFGSINCFDDYIDSLNIDKYVNVLPQSTNLVITIMWETTDRNVLREATTVAAVAATVTTNE